MGVCFGISAVAFLFQVIAWIGASKRSFGFGGMGGSYGAGFSLGSNFMLIIAIVFLIIGLVLRNKKKGE